MTAIPHAALALTSALDRFGLASSRVLGAVTGADEDLGSALVDMTMAKVQAKASVALIHFSNEMWDALLEIQRDPKLK